MPAPTTPTATATGSASAQQFTELEAKYKALEAKVVELDGVVTRMLSALERMESTIESLSEARKGSGRVSGDTSSWTFQDRNDGQDQSAHLIPLIIVPPPQGTVPALPTAVTVAIRSLKGGYDY